MNPFFNTPISQSDPLLADILQREATRQAGQIELIASENIVSQAVRDALGAAITNKTVEGYPGNRYHGGASIVDEAETLAIERAKLLFGCQFANVQPHSGSQANLAVFVTLLQPGDTVLSMALSAGGHLSHGAAPNLSGKWFNVHSYGVRPEDGRLDYDALRRLAHEPRPKLIITGGSAYPRAIDFPTIRQVADEVGALFLVDMAHFAGLVAGKAHPSPFPHADIVTCTTTKTLRGPRGGVILWNDSELTRRINSAVFPGSQGSIHLNVIAAKAVCLGEAMQPTFQTYARQVVENARTLAATLQARGYPVLTGGTDTHVLLVDLKPKGLTGDVAEKRLEAAFITSNKNSIPGDPVSPKKWTGVRLGTAAGTSRGFGAAEFAKIGGLIADVWDSVAAGEEETAVISRTQQAVSDLCMRFPTYENGRL
ncbi:MAG: serine hydroxymethyltransferase [Ardenticatenaceae bacterium]|nr:serine hydroxymethyltransferase [Ardenticatenaceae bacterium]